MTSDKSPGALRTIGEVAEHIGVATHVLRFWESKFPQIKPQKRRGRRYYRPEDVKYVTQIKSLLYGQGYTIKGAQKFLADDSFILSTGSSSEGASSSEAGEVVQLNPQSSLAANDSSLSEQNAQVQGTLFSEQDFAELKKVRDGLKGLKHKLSDAV